MTSGCVSQTYEWAHVHGTDPENPENYRSLCKSCHQIYDRQTGSDNANAKLTDAQAAEIRARYKAGGISQQALGDEFGVSQGAISLIVLGRTYRQPACPADPPRHPRARKRRQPGQPLIHVRQPVKGTETLITEQACP